VDTSADALYLLKGINQYLFKKIKMNYNNRGQERKNDVWSVLKNFDAFPKQREEAAEFFQRSASGGVITLVAAFFMTILFFSELGIYVKVRTVNELLVDTSRGETLQIHVRFSI
jgi:hypothetical protein